MKRKPTRKGAPESRAEAIRVWLSCWRDLPKKVIQAWIDRIPRHIQTIIELEGGRGGGRGWRDFSKGPPSLRIKGLVSSLTSEEGG